MKVYISADLEGVAGACQWSDVTIGEWDYAITREQLHREVQAACTGALQAGASEIVVKDAHDSGRNLDPSRLPAHVTLIRGWSGHPYSMIQGLDDSFAALIMIGYHSGAGSGANPLAHTLNPDLRQVRVNGQPMSEFHLMAYAAATMGIPTVFVSGDQGLCQEVLTFDPAMTTVSTLQGVGESVVVTPPHQVLTAITAGVTQSLHRHPPVQPTPPPEPLVLHVDYKHPPLAYRRSFYPGAQLVSDATVELHPASWWELMQALRFIGF
ncbi:MAG: M55 family metallopeptidase [Synechococcales cyanobacterium]